ncbi:hypothetical protein K1T71_006600 [Dendrolimus kikuchii]|uniref:Uncharacterized protein n=1 Tax=Dendrolimus kikuchii TaxID=765133 RepID=A0ACC1D2V7_9NEOP|nr:hypothetical protein K1T71_006600 [Dendrolimus kikuchii]
MQRLAATLTVICILLCLAFNYTFPLHRECSKWFLLDIGNRTINCDKAEHEFNIVERSKKMSNNIENAFKKMIDSTQDVGRNIYEHLNADKCDNKNTLSGEDLKQYEQLVIMKKYPYLDLKELELKFSPSGKNVRQNVKYESGINLGGDSGICEPVEDGPNVEIINRGLTGFAIPGLLAKPPNMVVENKLNLNNLKNVEDVTAKTSSKMTKKFAGQSDLKNLKDDIIEFEERKIKSAV